MRMSDRYDRWKYMPYPGFVIDTSFWDRAGNLIRIGDTLEYTRKKKTGWGKWRIPAGTVVQVSVEEISVRVKKDHLGNFKYLRAVNVRLISPVTENQSAYAAYVDNQVYRLYDTSYTLNLTTKVSEVTKPVTKYIEPDEELEGLVIADTRRSNGERCNDDIFSFGIPFNND